MELTGKCKEDFEKWYAYEVYPDVHHVFGMQEYYNAIPFSMQYSIYLDFFDSVGISFYVTPLFNMENKKEYTHRLETFEYPLLDNCDLYVSYNHNTRHEARKEAIKSANEIYNNQ